VLGLLPSLAEIGLKGETPNPKNIAETTIPAIGLMSKPSLPNALKMVSPALGSAASIAKSRMKPEQQPEAKSDMPSSTASFLNAKSGSSSLNLQKPETVSQSSRALEMLKRMKQGEK